MFDSHFVCSNWLQCRKPPIVCN